MDSADSSRSTSPSAAEPHHAGAEERGALSLLSTKVAPTLRGESNRSLVKAIRLATDQGDLGRLRDLSERERRELLTLIELRSPKAARPIDARAVVLLTTTLVGPSDEAVGRRLASPAR